MRGRDANDIFYEEARIVMERVVADRDAEKCPECGKYGADGHTYACDSEQDLLGQAVEGETS